MNASLGTMPSLLQQSTQCGSVVPTAASPSCVYCTAGKSQTHQPTRHQFTGQTKNQHEQPSLSFSRWMLMGSWLKSPLNSSLSSCCSALRAMTSKACSTLMASLAEVSK